SALPIRPAVRRGGTDRGPLRATDDVRVLRTGHERGPPRALVACDVEEKLAIGSGVDPAADACLRFRVPLAHRGGAQGRGVALRRLFEVLVAHPGCYRLAVGGTGAIVLARRDGKQCETDCGTVRALHRGTAPRP